MATIQRMLDLSPEEIRRISEKAVETVAAQKIVTTKGTVVNARVQGGVWVKASGATVHGHRNAAHSRRAKAMKNQKQPESKLTDQTRTLAESVLSQNESKQFLQKSFDKVVNDRKK